MRLPINFFFIFYGSVEKVISNFFYHAIFYNNFIKQAEIFFFNVRVPVMCILCGRAGVVNGLRALPSSTLRDGSFDSFQMRLNSKSIDLVSTQVRALPSAFYFLIPHC